MAEIAIVMPVFNRERSVGAAIESVLAQEFGDFELLIVDDGSRDGTVEAIRAYDDPRIRLILQDVNRGGNAARNRGVSEATAPLVAFIDSDDAFLPHKLGFLVAFFARRPDVDALIDSFELVYPPETGKPPAPRLNPVLDGSPEIEQAIFDRRVFKATPAISARRDAILRAGMFDETLRRRQDFDLMLRLTRVARCATTDAILWTKRWSADAISAKDDTFVAATVDLCRRHPQYLADPRFRPGLARDVARHFIRLGSKGALSVAAADARRLGREFGAGTLARLAAQGVGEIVRRKREKASR
jgi:glycosyltransferase involved in cell wall biosynthesis